MTFVTGKNLFKLEKEEIKALKSRDLFLFAGTKLYNVNQLYDEYIDGYGGNKCTKEDFNKVIKTRKIPTKAFSYDDENFENDILQFLYSNQVTDWSMLRAEKAISGEFLDWNKVEIERSRTKGKAVLDNRKKSIFAKIKEWFKKWKF